MTKKKFVSLDSSHKVYDGITEILSAMFDLTLVTSGTRPKQKLKTKNFKSVPLFRIFFSYYPGLYKYLKQSDFDIVHLRAYYRPYAITALVYAIIHKKKFFISEEQRNEPHSLIDCILFNIQLLFLRPILNLKVNKIICITKSAFDYLQNKGFKRLVYIPVPYKPKRKLMNINNKNKKLKIITVARFDWIKAHNVLIEAVKILIDDKKIRRDDIEVNLVGKGGYLEEDTISLVKKYGLADIIHFKGFIDNKVLDSYYRKHNLFVLPSRSEPVGMVVLEAMANGLPLIISSNTGIIEAVKPRQNGYIFKSDDCRDLARKIFKMRDRDRRQSFGEKSLEILKGQHSPERIRKEYAKAFK